MRQIARQKINWLIFFIPLAFAVNYVPSWQNKLLLFWFSVLGLIVTSAWIGTATEQLADRIGPTWGGMMNAGFGNPRADLRADRYPRRLGPSGQGGLDRGHH
jgi:Ca2+:H+ antiporter